MSTIGIFYGSTIGNTANAAKEIQKTLGEALVDLHDVKEASSSALNEYPILILGTSTWGYGEHQDDWAEYESNLNDVDFNGKKVAFFGQGDQYTYSDTYLDAMGLLYEVVKSKGATILGSWDTQGYEHQESKAEVDGKFVGLALDDDNQPELTNERIKTWIDQLRTDLNL